MTQSSPWRIEARALVTLAIPMIAGNVAWSGIAATDLLLVGQPTRGVDIGAIEFIHQQIVSLREAGKAVLLVSVELDEILSLADRVAVMFDGVIMGERRASETDEKELGLLMAGITEMPDKPIIDAVEEQLAAKEAREAKQHG